jgi:hypothetical protein
MATSHPIDVADVIRQLNESNEALEDQYVHVRAAVDHAAPSEETAMAIIEAQ